MRKPRLYDPRTGHRINAREHRRLLRYATRKIAYYDALADAAHERGLSAKRRATKVKWAKRVERLQARYSHWRTFKQILEDELKGRVEYEGKFSYRSRKQGEADRCVVNIRMRYVGKLPLPSDMEVKRAFVSLIAEGRSPKGWEYAWINWRNDRHSSRGWSRGNVRESDSEKDLPWAGNIFVGGGLTLGDMDTKIAGEFVIGEVEEDNE